MKDHPLRMFVIVVAYFLLARPILEPLFSLLTISDAPGGFGGFIAQLVFGALAIGLGVVVGGGLLIAGFGTAHLVVTRLLGWRASQ